MSVKLVKLACAPGVVVSVTTPLTFNSINPGLLCQSGIVFQTNGNLEEMGPGLGDLVLANVGEYLSNQPSGDGSAYDVRCASISAGSWNVEAAAVGVWVNMGSQRVWRVTVVAMSAPDTASCTAVFEIRPAGGGAVLATFTVTCTAEN